MGFPDLSAAAAFSLPPAKGGGPGGVMWRKAQTKDNPPQVYFPIEIVN
jgi:hypothetical protein